MTISRKSQLDDRITILGRYNQLSSQAAHPERASTTNAQIRRSPSFLKRLRASEDLCKISLIREGVTNGLEPVHRHHDQHVGAAKDDIRESVLEQLIGIFPRVPEQTTALESIIINY